MNKSIEQEVEEMAMDSLKSKWSHLYIGGYPKRPFPTNYENDLNMVLLGYYKKQCYPNLVNNTKEREALQKIAKLNSNYKLVDAVSIATEALEQSEPRMYSEEEVIGFGIWLGEKYWFNLSTYKWECRNEEGLYEVLDSKRLIELYIQSLFPQPTEPIKQINNCDGCQSNAPIKDGYHLDKDGKVYMTCQKSRYTTEKPLEPNQTEAEKVLEKYFPNPDDLVNGRVKSVIVKAMEEYATLARKQVIEEVEDWVNQCNNGISISLLDFKTYLQTLKK